MPNNNIALGLVVLLGLFITSCGGGGGGTPASMPISTNSAVVTGSIFAVSNSDVDSDVNALQSPFTANDSFASAQVIANFTRLGGYLNQPGQGAAGRSFDSGDVNDFFEVDLGAGQSVSVVAADAVSSNDMLANDIDLALFDSNQVLVDQSMSSGSGECVENLVAGKHYIQVSILQGASNYILSITSLPCTATIASGGLRLNTEFKPGEILVRLRDTSSEAAMHSELTAMAMEMEMMPHKDYARVTLRDSDQVMKEMGLAATAYRYPSESMQDKSKTLMIIKALQARGEFALVEPNYVYNAFASANDPLFARQWHYPLIRLPEAWDQAVGGSGATVAVLDTGVLTSHPDLQSNLVAGYDFISDPNVSNDGDGIDADPSDPGDSVVIGLSSFHGSHVLGTIGAVTNNNLGVAGAAFYSNIRVMPLRVLGLGGGSFADICEAMRFAARLPNVSNTLPAVAADVINMSLGSPAFSQFFQDCINEVRNRGVIIIAAAGNFASSAPSYPAAHNGVVSVSAVNLNRALADYSSFGPTIDVAGPGGEAADDNGDGLIDGVFSTIGRDNNGVIENTYGYLIGTSMAAPHVSAVAALMKSVAPNLTPDQFDAFLSAGELTDDLGPAGRDDSYGFGLINANKAVLRAQGILPTVPVLSVAPNGVNFGLTETVIDVSVANVGGGVLSVAPPSEDSGGWLNVSPPVGNGEGIYRLVADRSHPSLANPGSYTALLSFSSNGGTINVPILLQVLQSGQSDSANSGYQFILLFSLTNPDNDQVLGMAATAGRYEFRFDNVVADNYLLFSGTDNDNDAFVCDGGEACGALGTIDEPFVVQVDENAVIDIGSFFTGFNFATSLSSQSSQAAEAGAGVPLR